MGSRQRQSRINFKTPPYDLRVNFFCFFRWKNGKKQILKQNDHSQQQKPMFKSHESL